MHSMGWISQSPWASVGWQLALRSKLPPSRLDMAAPKPWIRCSEVWNSDFRQPGKMIVSGSARIIWAGRETAFLMGVAPPEGLQSEAALTDQSDGWAGLHLRGSGAEAVLARLVPLDLRLSAFAVHDAARTLLNHMPCLIFRPAETAFDVYVFRSMAGTAVHELTEAMRGVAARLSVWQE
jgi:heterotetrameric sarcosine oxidase gamma subunit